jgi:hypothetical protein
MRKSLLRTLAAAAAFAASGGALAQAFAPALSPEQYRAEKDGIAAEYKAAKASCASLAGNAKDVCKVQAAGEEKVSKAELEARYRPTVDRSYKARLARADANFALAKQECDDRAGNAKDVCVKEAKAAAVAARADAKAQMEIAKANITAIDKGVEARREAAADKRDADYAVAREKCEAFAGEVKSNCVSNAKARYGKL